MLENNVLEGFLSQIPKGVKSAIQNASHKTGVDFAYLVQQAGAESSFNPQAKAKTSSATGLFQFIESTWMQMIEKHGEKYGVSTQNKGRSELLALRENPEMASFMAAEFASENEKFLKSHYQGKIGPTELYFAHFLGAGGAAGFLNALQDNPMQKAADIMPKSAAANQNVFYDKATGRAKSLHEVYSYFDKKFSTDTKQIASKDFTNEKNNSSKNNTNTNAYTALKGRSPLHDLLTQNYQKNLSALAQKKLQVQDLKFSMHSAALNGFDSSQSSVFSSNHQSAVRGFAQLRLLSAPVDIMLLAQMDIPLKKETQSSTF